MTIAIAMWSGPRNISTAMMRAWENRSDTEVVDEPFYACYLKATGIEHPMTNEIFADQSSDWNEVAKAMIAPVIIGGFKADIFYQKQMTHHMLSDVDLEWTKHLKHCFLIRHPEKVVASYIKKRSTVTEEAVGFQRQYELYEKISEITSQKIPVIDSDLFLQNPEYYLKKICDLFEITFQSQMLKWPQGKRASDGVWASHWYQVVEKSTGFSAPIDRAIDLNKIQQQVVDNCLPWYQRMLDKSIT